MASTKDAVPPGPSNDPVAVLQQDAAQHQGQPRKTPLNKSKFNPCFCCDLRCGVISAGIVWIVLYTLGLIVVQSIYYNHGSGGGAFTFSMLGILHMVIGLASAILLTIGGVETEVKKSKIMIMVAFGGYILNLVLMIICAIILMAEDPVSIKSILIIGATAFIAALLYAYVLCVIYFYMRQLMRTKDQFTSDTLPLGTTSQQFSYQPPASNVGQSGSEDQGQGNP